MSIGIESADQVAQEARESHALLLALQEKARVMASLLGHAAREKGKPRARLLTQVEDMCQQVHAGVEQL